MPLVPDHHFMPDTSLMEMDGRIQRLIVALNKAAAPEGRSVKERPSKTRERLLATLSVITEFVEDLTDDHVEHTYSHASGLLVRLITSIKELQSGKLDPMLGYKRPGKKPAPYKYKESTEKDIALVYRKLRASGKTEKDCYYEIARAFGKKSFQVRSIIKNTTLPLKTKKTKL